jgi:hypothetical protein
MTDLPDIKAFFASLKRSEEARAAESRPLCERPIDPRGMPCEQVPTDREGTVEQGWSEDLGDAEGMLTPRGENKVVRKGNRMRRYRAENNTYTEYRIVMTEGGRRLVSSGCYFIKDPFVRDPEVELFRVSSYWGRVAAGVETLEERPTCAWCVYGRGVLAYKEVPMLFATIVCTNPDVVTGFAYRDRRCGAAYSRCNVRVNFSPSGVHAFAAEYLGWTSDPECVDRLELLARPPIRKDVAVDKPRSQESDAMALQRHHGFWEDDRPVIQDDVPPEPHSGAKPMGGGKGKTPSRKKKGWRR